MKIIFTILILFFSQFTFSQNETSRIKLKKEVEWSIYIYNDSLLQSYTQGTINNFNDTVYFQKTDYVWKDNMIIKESNTYYKNHPDFWRYKYTWNEYGMAVDSIDKTDSIQIESNYEFDYTVLYSYKISNNNIVDNDSCKYLYQVNGFQEKRNCKSEFYSSNEVYFDTFVSLLDSTSANFFLYNEDIVTKSYRINLKTNDTTYYWMLQFVDDKKSRININEKDRLKCLHSKTIERIKNKKIKLSQTISFKSCDDIEIDAKLSINRVEKNQSMNRILKKIEEFSLSNYCSVKTIIYRRDGRIKKIVDYNNEFSNDFSFEKSITSFSYKKNERIEKEFLTESNSILFSKHIFNQHY